MELLKTSWPFDSDPNVTYDDLGYPILDRAVGADTLQRTFDKFFSDGVFSTSDFRISAASGLSVNIQPGMCIINGGMAGWWDEPKVVALSATAPQWLTHYAIFLRYDNNDDMRGIYLRIDASAAGGSVPEPQSAANVTELRIGYVTVPANATDLSGATFHNGVGTSKAPITVPLFDIDPIPILEDLRERADAAYQAYYDLLISAVDGTTAGHLQAQIDELKENQFTEDDIDPLAIREQMGLGSTGGVLQPEYGGTGTDSIGEFAALLAASAPNAASSVDAFFSYSINPATYQLDFSVSENPLIDESLGSVEVKRSGVYQYVVYYDLSLSGGSFNYDNQYNKGTLFAELQNVSLPWLTATKMEFLGGQDDLFGSPASGSNSFHKAGVISSGVTYLANGDKLSVGTFSLNWAVDGPTVTNAYLDFKLIISLTPLALF